jgi:hypothetical protein
MMEVGTNPVPVGEGPTDPAGPAAEVVLPFEPAPASLRRLTRTQFHNAIRDVFGVEVDVNALDADSWDGNFAAIGAANVVTSERGVEQYQEAIEYAVDAVFSDPAQLDGFVGCDPSGVAGDACLRGYIEKLGRRAWRRPLDVAETDLLEGVALTTAAEFASPVEGARWATVALFTSPNFLYRPELGAVDAAGAYRLTSYEMASRLSFLIWNSLPDDELLDDAAAGLLETPEGIRSAAERLIGAAAGRAAIGVFAEELMRLDRVGTQAKDAELFPEYGPSLQAAMQRDMREVWAIVAFDELGTLGDLFSTSTVVVNRQLAELYGVDATGLDENSFEVRTLGDGDPRVGILGKAGFLSQFANQKEGSPTLRGKFIRDSLMCQTVPPPPPDVSTVLADSTPDRPMTKRERLDAHRADPDCALCHALMDPLGFPFESFDAIGRFRTTEEGLTIDPTSEFDGQPVANAREMALAIAASESVTDCMTRRFYSYALGHEERDVDASAIAELRANFEASGFNLRELILDVVLLDAFSLVEPQP